MPDFQQHMAKLLRCNNLEQWFTNKIRLTRHQFPHQQALLEEIAMFVSRKNTIQQSRQSLVRQSTIQDTRGGSTSIAISLSPSRAGLMVLKALEKSKNMTLTVLPCLSRWV